MVSNDRMTDHRARLNQPPSKVGSAESLTKSNPTTHWISYDESPRAGLGLVWLWVVGKTGILIGYFGSIRDECALGGWIRGIRIR
jgi:hypothetical protein